jgi:hypothetical protein
VELVCRVLAASWRLCSSNLGKSVAIPASKVSTARSISASVVGAWPNNAR